MTSHADNRPTRFDIIERAARRTSQIFASFKKLDAELATKGIGPHWDPTDTSVHVILMLADGLIDYLECPRANWAQDTGNLRFFTDRTRGVLHMNFDLRVAGIDISSALGVAPIPNGQEYAVFWLEKQVSKVILGDTESMNNLFEELAKRIESDATEAAKK